MKPVFLSRRALLGIVPAIFFVTTAGMTAFFWTASQARSRLMRRRYEPLLSELVRGEAIGSEILEIGKDYLSKNPGQTDPLLLLRELSDVDLAQFERAGLSSAVDSIRAGVTARMKNDAARGNFVNMNNYIVPNSFAKFCAALFLILKA
jgi:hypothetical protein